MPIQPHYRQRIFIQVNAAGHVTRFDRGERDRALFDVHAPCLPQGSTESKHSLLTGSAGFPESQQPKLLRMRRMAHFIHFSPDINRHSKEFEKIVLGTSRKAKKAAEKKLLARIRH